MHSLGGLFHAAISAHGLFALWNFVHCFALVARWVEHDVGLLGEGWADENGGQSDCDQIALHGDCSLKGFYEATDTSGHGFFPITWNQTHVGAVTRWITLVCH